MEVTKQMSVSDDEEDLEALRLAALQSLKKKSVAYNEGFINNQVNFPQHHERELRHDHAVRHGNRHNVNFSGPRGRFFVGRGTKNGQFPSNRVRSGNLISITPVGSENDNKPETLGSFGKSNSSLHKRYDGVDKSSDEKKSDETSSKFDRFNDSDKSDDESEEEAVKHADSDDDSPIKLERSDSLEALMQELDDEIQGRTKDKEKSAKVKTKTKRKKEKSLSEPEVDGDKVEKESKVEIIVEKPKSNDKLVADTEEDRIHETVLPPREKSVDKEPQFKKRRHSPPNRREFHNFRGKSRNFPPSYQKPPFTVPMPYPPGNVPPVFTSAFGPPNLGMPPINAPPFFERPLSPLLINADTLQNQTMAPLSPRSAAFVLQNRAIVEKRKRSPRRSYSRSPSPRSRSLSPRSPRRSLSPRRILSPRRSISPRRPLSMRRSLSPRRSSSPRRNLSPRRSPMRRSLSPKRRSLSPKRRSLSPKRRSLSPKRRSLSPKRRSLSPKRRALSPRPRAFSPNSRTFSPKPRQYSPKHRLLISKRRSASPKKRSVSPRRRDKKESGNSPKNKLSIRDRLGVKTSSKSDNKESKDKSPASSPKRSLDPILEARKRKFESKEIKVREGKIRLRPKEEQEKMEELPVDNRDNEEKVNNTNNPDEIPAKIIVDEPKEQMDEELLDEDALLEDDELELLPKVDLFSDEDSGSENEGRFKAKEQATAKPAVLPFSKLINGEKKEIKNKPLIENSKRQRTHDRSRSPRIRKKDEKSAEKKSVVTANNTKTATRSEKSAAKRRIMLKSERHPTPKRFERKIEIKIKNPSKYEKEEKAEPEKDNLEKVEKGVRKVELGKTTKNEGDDEEDFETEIVVENEEDEVENALSNEGDLRAQLSKKRAEKLQKNVSNKGVTSRLLQNALQNALPMKKPKRPKSKELSSSDGKLPIHFRLGIAGSSDVFTSKSKRKSRKRKNLETEDQV